MSEQRRPKLQLSSSTLTNVRPGEEFSVIATVTNTTGVIDAFNLFVLGLDSHTHVCEPAAFVALFPEHAESVIVKITLPDDYSAGASTIWFKASSEAEPAIDVVMPLQISVEQKRCAALGMFPSTLVAGRRGRFGVSVSNTGNGPMNVSLDGADEENSFTYAFVPPEPQRIAAGATVSFQAILTGHRPFTGAAIPKQFTITPSDDGAPLTDVNNQPLQAQGMFAPKPLVPMLVLVFGGVVALLALWAVIVGAAIDAVVDDANDDLTSSIEEGMNAVVGGLNGDEDATEAARAEVLAAAGAAGLSTSGDGAGGDGADGGSGALGLAGQAVGVTVGAAEMPDDDRPMDVAPNELAGKLSATSNNSPLPGAKVTAQALLPSGNFLEEVQEGQLAPVMVRDPNREPIEAVADEVGNYRMPDLLPGAYDVVIEVPGYDRRVCKNVIVPGPAVAPNTDDQNVCPVAGHPVDVTLAGDPASVAGIVTVDGSPFEATGGQELFVTLSRLRPVQGDPEGAPAPTAAVSGLAAQAADPDFEPRTQRIAAGENELPGARFSFELGIDPASTPGTFELLVTATGYADQRQVFDLGPGENLIGLEVPMSLPHPAATPPGGRVLSGAVLDGARTIPGGNPPLAGATVSIVGPGASFTVSTDASGVYELTGVPTGTYTVTVAKEDYITAAVKRTVSVPTTPAGAPVILTPAPGSLTGVVRDARTDDAVAGAIVTISPAPPNASGTAVTDVDGAYEFASIGPGSFVVTVASPSGTTTYRATSGTVRIGPNQNRIADITLEPTTPNGVVTGIVTDLATEVPLSGVVVSIASPGSVATTTTDAGGWFRFDELAIEANHTLTFNAATPGFVSTTRLVRLGADEQERTLAVALLPQRGVVSGTVTNVATGGPLAGISVSISPPAGAATTTDASGWFRIDTLQAQTTYELTFAPIPGFDGTSRFVSLGLDPEQTLTVALVPQGVVTGTVTSGGPFVAGVTVTVTGPGGPTVAVTDAAGKYEIKTLTPGSHAVTFSKPGFISQSLPATLTGSTPTNVSVVLVPEP